MNKFLKEFKDRGYFYQCTSENELSKLLDKEKIINASKYDNRNNSVILQDIKKIISTKFFQKLFYNRTLVYRIIWFSCYA